MSYYVSAKFYLNVYRHSTAKESRCVPRKRPHPDARPTAKWGTDGDQPAARICYEVGQDSRCSERLHRLSSDCLRFYEVTMCGIRVLAARPLHVRERGTFELFGDYDPETSVIRVWMRTAVRKDVTSFGTFVSTLCHEFCHHLDFQKFGFPDSWHTRGFYERAAALYHHARGTPLKRLFWVPMAGGRWRIDWQRTNRGA